MSVFEQMTSGCHRKACVLLPDVGTSNIVCEACGRTWLDKLTVLPENRIVVTEVSPVAYLEGEAIIPMGASLGKSAEVRSPLNASALDDPFELARRFNTSAVSNCVGSIHGHDWAASGICNWCGSMHPKAGSPA